MSRIGTFYRSTLGKKAVVAVTGVVLFLFVLMHMLGNLKVFFGTDAEGVQHVDLYARFLRTMGEPLLPHSGALWITRAVLLAAFAAHVYTVLQLRALNRAARPVAYRKDAHESSTYAARSMILTGVLLGLFVVFHILHFTTGTIEIGRFAHGAVFSNLSQSFRVWGVALLYVGAMGVLGLHLYHGTWSLFQTLGYDNPDRNRGLRLFAAGSAAVIAAGFVAVPLFFLLGGGGN